MGNGTAGASRPPSARECPLSDCIGRVCWSTMRSKRAGRVPRRDGQGVAPARVGAAADRRIARKSKRNSVSVHAQKPANLLADWTRSEPTTAGIAERSAVGLDGLHGVALVVRPAGACRCRHGNRFLRRSTRGGVLTSSLRSEPRTFNRWVDRNFPPELISQLTQSQADSHQPLDAGDRAGSGRIVDRVARQPDLHADPARGDLVRRHAVHVGRRALHLQGGLRPQGQQHPGQLAAGERPAARRSPRPTRAPSSFAIPARSVRASPCSTT